LRTFVGVGVSLGERMSRGIFYTILTASVLGLQTAPVAQADVAGLVGKEGSDRWLIHMQQDEGGNVAALKGKAGVAIENGITTTNVSVSSKIKHGLDPERINNAIKAGRVVETTARQAPKNFTAGSMVEQHSVLRPVISDPSKELAFLKPKPAREAIRIATVFNPKTNSAMKDDTSNLSVQVASLVEQSRPSVLSYVPEPVREPSPFAAVLTQPVNTLIKPKLNRGDHSWADDPLPKDVFSKRQQKCLAQGIYFEARGEPAKGQAAVAQVILNRVRAPSYPNSICGVVYQNRHWHNRCQFSFACDRIRDLVRNRRAFSQATDIARETTTGRIWLSEVGSSTHYHATYVSPRWARAMRKVGKIGQHIFYRTRNGGWS